MTKQISKCYIQFNLYLNTYPLLNCEKYHFEILYPYYMSDYFSMHFAALQNKINCLAATKNATA